jgi:hypothetical protein
VEQRAREHLETARRHQRFAQSLLDLSKGSQVLDGQYEWAIVSAFYSAMHYVHAYLWERHRYYPRSHAARANRVKRDPVLRRCEAAYLRHLGESLSSRYDRLPVAPELLARGLIEVNLAHVESIVTAEI